MLELMESDCCAFIVQPTVTVAESSAARPTVLKAKTSKAITDMVVRDLFMSFGSPAALPIKRSRARDFVRPPFGGVTLLGTFPAPPSNLLSRISYNCFPLLLLYIIPKVMGF